MLNPNSTIYQSEWLDLVFANRNKSYGAYELRQNYNKRLTQALLLMLTSVMVLVCYVRFSGTSIPEGAMDDDKLRNIVITLSNPIPAKKILIQPASPPAQTPAKKVKVT